MEHLPADGYVEERLQAPWERLQAADAMAAAGAMLTLEEIVAKALGQATIYIPWEPPAEGGGAALFISATGETAEVVAADAPVNEEVAHEGGGLWGRLKKRVATVTESVDAEASKQAGRKVHIGLTALLTMAEAMQDENEVAIGRSKKEKVDDEQRAGWHESFKKSRRKSIAPNAAMLQALEKRQKEADLLQKQATERQAKSIAEGRVSTSPCERETQRRQRRLSFGDDAVEGSKSLTEIWAKSGTADDLFRPENNQAGFVAPTAKECVAEVMARHDKAAADAQLKHYLSPRGPDGGRAFTPTRPCAPRLGVGAYRRAGSPASDEGYGTTDESSESLSSSPGRSPGRATSSLASPGRAASPSGRVSPVSERPLCFYDGSPLGRMLRKAQGDESPLPSLGDAPLDGGVPSSPLAVPKAQTDAEQKSVNRILGAFEKRQAWLGFVFV